MGKYKVRKGDSWISIANNNGLNLNDLLYWNGIDPMSREQLPMINPGAELYISDPYRLQPSMVTAQAPQDYTEFGEAGQDLINKYALAVRQGKLKFDQVPKVYKTAVYQKMITNTTDKAAHTIFNAGLNTGLAMTDPIGYGLALASQKGAAYANDAASGRHEYGIGDLLDYTPVMGTQYAQENPGKSIMIDAGAGLAGGAALRNLPNWIRYVAQNGRGMMQNALRTTGMQRQVQMQPGNQTFGTVYTSGGKGVGKTGTVRAGHVGGYQPNASAKGTFGNQSSGNATRWIAPDKNIPAVPVNPVPFRPVMSPVFVPPPVEPPVRVPTPEKHIYEQQSFNRWQMPNPTGVVGPYQPGTGIFSISGHAPVGNTVDQQALTRESLKFYPNDYAPRIATFVPEEISGTPSNVFSGLGILYGSENPGSLIVK